MKEETKKILEIITNIQEVMATKEDLKGMASKSDLNGMATKEDIADLRKEMATKKDLADIRREMATKDDLEKVRRDLHAQIVENTEAIDNLSEQMENVMGFSKEIDHVLSRVSVLEKQVGSKGH